MKPSFEKICHIGSAGSLAALIAVCIAWEMWLAPLRPGGSWLALKAVPLLIPLAGVIKRDVYTMQWASMMILLYFTEGVVRASSATGVDAGMSAILALIEVGLACVFFICTILYLRPYKKAAKQLAKQAIEKASHPK